MRGAQVTPDRPTGNPYRGFVAGNVTRKGATVAQHREATIHYHDYDMI
jgi:hypothetical protein